MVHVWEHLLGSLYHTYPKGLVRCIFCRERFRREEPLPDRTICHRCLAENSKCEHCGLTEGVRPRTAHTNYHYEGEPGWNDPNRPRFYCPECAEEDAEYWKGLLTDYYNNCA